MNQVILIGLLFICSLSELSGQNPKIDAHIRKVLIEYNEKQVKARELTVSSQIPMNLDSAWANVKTPALLRFVAKGMIRFHPVNGDFPKQWQKGQTYAAKMRILGFIPFGGTHYLFIEKVDEETFEIATKEWDRGAKVWNHHVMIKDLGNGRVYYEDSIIIYGGFKTGFITSFAKIFYKHRQKRWQIVAREKLYFAE